MVCKILLLFFWTIEINNIYGQKIESVNQPFKIDGKIGFKQAAYPQSISCSKDSLLDGKCVIRFELNREDSIVHHGKRSEISFPAEVTIPVERWYAFSIFVPDFDSIDLLPEIVAQWHAVPDLSLGENWRSPPISLRIQNGHWRLVNLWALDSKNSNRTYSGREITDFGLVNYLKWTRWVFHIIFSFKKDGLLEIWNDGNLIYKKNGSNYYNDYTGPFFKFGIYKWDWMDSKIHSRIEKRIIYFKDVKLGDENSSFKAMNN
jgi:hypothetical protein